MVLEARIRALPSQKLLGAVEELQTRRVTAVAGFLWQRPDWLAETRAQPVAISRAPDSCSKGDLTNLVGVRQNRDDGDRNLQTP